MPTWLPTDGTVGDHVGEEFASADLLPNIGSFTDGSDHANCLEIVNPGPVFGYSSGFQRGGTASVNALGSTDCHLEAGCVDEPQTTDSDVWWLGICQATADDPVDAASGYYWRKFLFWDQCQVFKDGAQVASDNGWGDQSGGSDLGLVRIDHDGAGLVSVDLDSVEQFTWTDTGTLPTGTHWGLEGNKAAFSSIKADTNGAPPVGTNDLRLGTATPDDYRLGATAVDRIYLGSTLVYEP